MKTCKKKPCPSGKKECKCSYGKKVGGSLRKKYKKVNTHLFNIHNVVF